MGIRDKYNQAKGAKVGDTCICPSCGSEFVKGNYQQAFCKNRGGTKCKDKYWNTVTPQKMNNTTRISPASARYTARQEEIRDREFNPDDYEHPFSSDALG